MPDNPCDLPTIAEDFINCMVSRSSDTNKPLSKDEILTYNSALRMLKAFFDRTTEVLYEQEPKLENSIKDPFRKGDDDDLAAAIA